MSFFSKLFSSDKDKDKGKSPSPAAAAPPAVPAPPSPRLAPPAVLAPPPQLPPGNNPMLPAVGTAVAPSAAAPMNRPPVPQLRVPANSGGSSGPSPGDGGGSDRSSVVFNTSNSFGNVAHVSPGALPSRSQSLVATPRGESQGPPPGWVPNPAFQQFNAAGPQGQSGPQHQGGMFYGGPPPMMQQGGKGPPMMMMMMRGKGPMQPPFLMHGQPPPQGFQQNQAHRQQFQQQHGVQWMTQGPPQMQQRAQSGARPATGAVAPGGVSVAAKSAVEPPAEIAAWPKPTSPNESSVSGNTSVPTTTLPQPQQAIGSEAPPSGERTPPAADTTQLPESPHPTTRNAAEAAAVPIAESSQRVEAVSTAPAAVPSIIPPPAPAPVVKPLAETVVRDDTTGIRPVVPIVEDMSPSHGTEVIHNSDGDDDEEDNSSDIQFAEEEEAAAEEEARPRPIAEVSVPVSGSFSKSSSGSHTANLRQSSTAPGSSIAPKRENSVEFAPPVRRVDTAEPPQLLIVPASKMASTPSSPKSPAISAPAESSRYQPTPIIPPLTLAANRPGSPVAKPLAPPSSAVVPPALRQRIINQFLSILCPQQYCGKVVRLHSIRSAAPSATSTAVQPTSNGCNNTIFVVSYPSSSTGDGSTLYYPQVRLSAQDASASASTQGLFETSCVLFEATLGLMSFAETVQDATSMLFRGACDSCFVTSVSAILVGGQKLGAGSGVANVTRVASLVVEWRPHSTPASDMLCQVHKCPMELFDLNRKELLCALCTAKTNGGSGSASKSNPSRRICVLSEMLTRSNAHDVENTFKQRLDDLSESISRNIHQHQRLTHLGAKRREAINNQFDMFIAAVEAKREEFIEASSAEFASSTSAASKEILVADEQACMIKAAVEHLRAVTGPDAPPPGTPNTSRFLQIATVAQALQTVKESPAFRKGSSGVGNGIPAVRTVLPNLEGALNYIQQLPLTAGAANGGGTSPFNLNDSRGSNDRTNRSGVYSPPQQRKSPIRSKSAGGTTPNGCRTPGDRRVLADEYRQLRRTSPRRDRHHQPPGEAALYAVPGKNGTCLFNCPLQGMIEEGKLIQWVLRVDDPGDWVGVGVGVGGSIEQWHTGQTFDLSHLWIVSPRMPKTLVLRISSIANGNAKLSIFDKRGKQLDDGRIAHWNTLRPCFPQVSFGGRNGKVTMIETPHAV